MTKEQLQQKLQESENKCRVIYDQYVTTQENLKQLKVELERARGAYKTFQDLVAEEEKATGDRFPKGGKPADKPSDPAVSHSDKVKEPK